MQEWLTYTTWLQKHLPQYHQTLQPGAAKDDIDALAKRLGVTLPGDFYELYQINNGDCARTSGFYIGAFLGFTFLSLAGIEETWNSWREFYDKDIFDGEYQGSSRPEGHIKLLYANPKWIPLFKDGTSNYIGLDLDPDMQGCVGQVINFGRDEDDKIVIAKNLKDFLFFIAQKAEKGKLNKAIVKEDDGGYSFGLKPQSHLIDDLKEMLY